MSRHIFRRVMNLFRSQRRNSPSLPLTHRRVRRCLKELPPEFRQPVMFLLYERRPYAQVADDLRLTNQELHDRVTAGLILFRDAMIQRGWEFDPSSLATVSPPGAHHDPTPEVRVSAWPL